jgi:hypothetical protein
MEDQKEAIAGHQTEHKHRGKAGTQIWTCHTLFNPLVRNPVLLSGPPFLPQLPAMIPHPRDPSAIDNLWPKYSSYYKHKIKTSRLTRSSWDGQFDLCSLFLSLPLGLDWNRKAYSTFPCSATWKF